MQCGDGDGGDGEGDADRRSDSSGSEDGVMVPYFF